jgi:uncharacterized protein
MHAILTLVIAGAGGALFSLAGLPAAWLAGSMVAVTAAVLLRFPAAIYDPARTAVFIILGIQIGGSIGEDTLQRMANWPESLAILSLTVVAVTWCGYWFFRRFHGWDRATSLFSSVPGALSLTLLLADQARADMPRVTIVQGIRLFFLVAVLPLVIDAAGNGGSAAAAAAASSSLRDATILVAAGSAGAFLAHRARMPAGLVLGAMAASAAAKIGGLVDGPLTDALLLPAYVVLGAMIGARFRGFEPSRIARLLLAGITGFLIAMVIALAGAVAAHRLSDLPLALTLVAFAPGGLEAMTIMAFALDLDPAYVGAMQIARYVGISLLLPIIGKALEGMWRSSGGWNS